FVGSVTCTNSQAVLHFLVSTTATTPSTAQNVAIIGGAPNSTVTVNIVAPTATPTITLTPAATNTPTRTATPTTGVPPTPVVSGTPGVGCTTVIGGTCTITGTVAGSCTKTGSGPCGITATGPTNPVIGGVPSLL